jgi:ubiquitin-protein ligase
MDEGRNKNLLESYKLKESMGDDFQCPYPFIVNAVFQKYGIKNANGRIYPEEVLKREVEKYQQAIQERRAYGECYTTDAMVLTSDGWKSIIDIKEGDDVLTLNTKNNEIETQTVTRKIERKHNGKLICIKSEHINDLVTPGHGFPIYDKNDKFKGFYTAQDILDKKIPEQNHCYIPVINDSIKGIYLNDELLTVTEEEYNGDVMCIEVPNHTWYVMQNGKCHWTKNCNHPDSTAIDVGRICLNIIELHWEGKTLVGQMEIPITEAFRRTGAITCLADQVAHFLLSGLKLGVSSRGIGNVEQKYGTTIVTDYELICWDLVSQPSTPNAWIGNTIDDLKPYIESVQPKENAKLLTDLNKFNEWLD